MRAEALPAPDMRTDQDLSALERHGAALKLLSDRLDNTIARLEGLTTKAFGPLDQIGEPPTSKQTANEPQGTMALLAKLIVELNARVNKANNVIDKLEALI